ncbi:MAG: hypothetical protein ACOC0A_00150 [Planctomycetota bacterium]
MNEGTNNTDIIRSCRGAAMTETALLCFFIYVPVLMMVIVWGDMTLDKERAHIAASYMAFKSESVDEDSLRDNFFPFADGSSDPTGSVRRVSMDPAEDDRAAEGPEFTLPSSRTGDYSGSSPEFDLQYKLYSLAIGDAHVTQEMQKGSGGGMEFVNEVERIQNDVTRYLTENDIVPMEAPEEGMMTIGEGSAEDDVVIETGFDSRAYTEYVSTLVRIMNGEWGGMGETMPRMESMAALETTFQSPFLSELEREESAPARGQESEQYAGSGPFPRVGGQPGFRMQFGQPESLEKDDDSFHTGYTYLRNPDARPDADAPWEYVGGLSSELFEYSDTGARLVDMGQETSLSSERKETGDDGIDDMRYLEAGDPRPSEWRE